MLEEELEAVRREVTDLQHRLSEVEDQREALEEGALTVFHVVEPGRPCRWTSSMPSLRSFGRR